MLNHLVSSQSFHGVAVEELHIFLSCIWKSVIGGFSVPELCAYMHAVLTHSLPITTVDDRVSICLSNNGNLHHLANCQNI